jgi:hypothetical protein
VSTRQEVTGDGSPWSSRMSAIRWFSRRAKQAGTSLNDLKTFNLATRSARDAAGPGATARREQARREHADQTALELKKLRAVIRSLRGIEREERRCLRPLSLAEAVSQELQGLPDWEHWRRLADLEKAVVAFEAAFRASTPKPTTSRRGRGERIADAEQLASDRYVAAFFATSVG